MLCDDCGYVYLGEACCNPACVRVNPEAHAAWKERDEREEAELAERERVRRWAAERGWSAL